MSIKTVEYESGHALKDNGVGDYSLHCPNTGEVGFMHTGLVVQIERCRCGACGLPIGKQVSTAKPYEAAA